MVVLWGDPWEVPWVVQVDKEIGPVITRQVLQFAPLSLQRDKTFCNITNTICLSFLGHAHEPG